MNYLERLSIKHPLLLFSLWQLKFYNPPFFKYFLVYYLAADLVRDVNLFFALQGGSWNEYWWVSVVFLSIVGLLMKLGLRRAKKAD